MSATYYAERIERGACPGCDSFGRCRCEDEEPEFSRARCECCGRFYLAHRSDEWTFCSQPKCSAARAEAKRKERERCAEARAHSKAMGWT